MNQLVTSLATMVGMLPNSSKDMANTMAQVQAWWRGVVFGLAALAALAAIITGSVWIAQVIAPRLLGI